MVHPSRGRPSSRKLQASFRKQVTGCVRERCRGFGPALAGIHTIEAANHFLEELYMPLCNRRFVVASASKLDAHCSALIPEAGLAATLTLAPAAPTGARETTASTTATAQTPEPDISTLR